MFKIPQVDPEVYSDWRILLVPFYHRGQLVRIQPEMTSVAIGHTSGSMFDTSKCLYTNPRLCPNTVVFSRLPCTQGILSRSVVKMSLCLLQRVNVTIPNILQISDSQVLLTGPSDVLTERCLGRPARGFPSPDGSSVLHVSPNCTVSSDQYGWKFSVGSKRVTTRIIHDEFLLNGIALNFSLAEVPTLPPLDWPHLQSLANLTHHQLPELESLLNVSFLATPHMATWLGVGAIIVVLVFVGVVVGVKVRKSPCCKPLASGARLSRSSGVPLSERFSNIAPSIPDASGERPVPQARTTLHHDQSEPVVQTSAATTAVDDTQHQAQDRMIYPNLSSFAPV